MKHFKPITLRHKENPDQRVRGYTPTLYGVLGHHFRVFSCVRDGRCTGSEQRYHEAYWEEVKRK
jgi:hypothetical protein